MRLARLLALLLPLLAADAYAQQHCKPGDKVPFCLRMSTGVAGMCDEYECRTCLDDGTWHSEKTGNRPCLPGDPIRRPDPPKN